MRPDEERRREDLRRLIWAAIAFVLAVAFVIAILLFAGGRAHGANICERHKLTKVYTRGGRSWRCRRVRHAALRFRKNVVTKAIPQGELEIRTVRTIRFYPGLTPHQRIERGFDKINLFPVEDEP